jgi:cytosine/adenosine deaminase-related metal-dependent hydrolase
MRIDNVRIIGNNTNSSILVRDGIISSVTGFVTGNAEPGLYFENAIAFPGLINSHDHLDFNLLPRLGNRIYQNYRQWAGDIQLNNKAAIQADKHIPQDLRVSWGIYKNLLAGVTTVVNHGNRIAKGNELIHVFEDCHSLHSVAFEKNWRMKLNKRNRQRFPFAIHTGEGTDRTASLEIDQLINWNLFKQPLVGIHGVAMTEKQAAHFKALVWCPVSNYFLLNKTAAVENLKNYSKILFGTDSTLTGNWNAWEHLRLARTLQKLTDKELYNAVTSSAAELWGMNDRGLIAENKKADIVIAEKNNTVDDWDNFYSTNPESILLVLVNGRPVLFDERIKEQLAGNDLCLAGYSKILTGKNSKYIMGDLPGLIENIRTFNPVIELPVNPAK